ncbi:hypothetical protein F383_23182 [Gossypium arboreum]|uniref:Uncharacterized protein n=1 Tax=Gossypium arboreum TaxID=29729 RepID=A0A0B0MFJ5_GOSAR|nr:hypothetical protein F383_21644 [Gossypium arboreum]KHG01187.1 hypothetical protein F383_23182 [Gossypium arboreum]
MKTFKREKGAKSYTIR